MEYFIIAIVILLSSVVIYFAFRKQNNLQEPEQDETSSKVRYMNSIFDDNEHLIF